jgi:SHS2 domain-containing protein
VGRFVFLDEIALADCAVEVEGRDPPDLFETAAAALAELMVDPRTVAPTVERTIELAAPRLDLLLYDWLSDLILRKDRDREVFTSTRVRLSGSGPCELRAEARGGVIDPASVALRADPKAVTFHRFALDQVAGGWRARIVIDI